MGTSNQKFLNYKDDRLQRLITDTGATDYDRQVAKNLLKHRLDYVNPKNVDPQLGRKTNDELVRMTTSPSGIKGTTEYQRTQAKKLLDYRRNPTAQSGTMPITNKMGTGANELSPPVFRNPLVSEPVSRDKIPKSGRDKMPPNAPDGMYNQGEMIARPAVMAFGYNPKTGQFVTAGSGTPDNPGDFVFRGNYESLFEMFPKAKARFEEGKRIGFSNLKPFTSTGNTDMAQQQDLKGKTGKELQEAILQEQAGQAEQQALDPSQELELQKRRVRPGELIDPNAYNIPETTITASKKLDTDDFQQQSPEKTAAPTYDATKVGSIGEMKEVAGEVSDKAVMDAAQGSLSEGALATAATEELDARATVKYQMAELFKSIEEGSELPPWASPAVRKVSAIMAQRGLGSSSMAASAITQAIYEAGIPIAVQDANKYGTIQLQNLNNRQQAALQNATATASMDMANLNNRQASAVNNAKTFLTMDMQNLTNAQQKATIDYQTTTSSLFTDAAADNAAKQFNAKTQNEVDQFFAELGSQVETTAINRNVALEQYNISQTQAVEQFNAQMIAQRETFNSNARRQIDASNAVWRRTINTENTALQNEENRTNLQTLLNLSQIAQNNLWQLYRDQAAWTMQTSENNLDRAHNAAMQAAAISERSDMYDSKFDDFLIIKTIDNIFG